MFLTCLPNPNIRQSCSSFRATGGERLHHDLGAYSVVADSGRTTQIASEILYFQWSRIAGDTRRMREMGLTYSISVAGIRNTARYRSPR